MIKNMKSLSIGLSAAAFVLAEATSPFGPNPVLLLKLCIQLEEVSDQTPANRPFAIRLKMGKNEAHVRMHGSFLIKGKMIIFRIWLIHSLLIGLIKKS